MEFRQDINGLRALAVLPVIFFHSGVKLFSGGFLGVDVFFAISGFIITLNILKNKKENTFCILSFYNKRARRILPALLVTLGLTSILAFIYMLPYELKNYGQSLVATSLASNNILLYVTSGYWSLAAEYKPLYHTWSLGIEEQYYLVTPILFALLLTKKIKLFIIMALILVISLASSWVIKNEEFNFLIITSRFWELGFGTMLAVYVSQGGGRVKSDIISCFGLLLILCSYVNPYLILQNRSLVSVIPVLGVLIMITFTRENGKITRLLTVKPLAIIGLASFSIYLIHQPILACLRLASEERVSSFKQVSFALGAVPLGILMWKYVETPFRNKMIVSNKLFYRIALPLIVFFILLGTYLHKTYGMQENKIFSKYSYGNNPQAYADKPYYLLKNEFSSKKSKMLIVGNSFARDFLNALMENKATDGYEVIYLKDYYADINISRGLLKKADVVIFVSSSGMANRVCDEAALVKASLKLKSEIATYAKGKFFYVGTKNFGLNNNFVRRMNWDSTLDHMVPISKSAIIANKIEKNIFQSNYIDLISLLSEGDKIRLFTDEHRFISFDTDHITKEGAIYLGKKICENTAIKEIILFG